MDNLFGWFVGASILFATILTPMYLASQSSAAKTISKVQAGLEECPVKPGSYNTIWVKSCKEYVSISKDY